MISQSNCERAANLLKMAAYVQAIEFYVFQSSSGNAPAELHCRIFGLPHMTKAGLEVFALALNAGIQSPKDMESFRLQQAAKELLREGM